MTDLAIGQRAVLEKLVQQLLVGLGRGLDHLLAPLFGFRLRYPPGFHEPHRSCPCCSRPSRSPSCDQIDHAGLKFSSAPIGSWIGTGVGAEALTDLIDDSQEVGTGTVHLVDENHARHAVLVALAPDRLGLGLARRRPNTAP